MDDTYPSGSSSIVKTVPVIRDLSLNPSCSHGPTILFERNGSRFFTCSAYRSQKLCPFYMPEENWKVVVKKKEKVNEVCKEGQTEKRCFEKGGGDGKDRCSSKRMKINHPLATPNQTDKGEAQYHFNEETVTFFMKQLKRLKIDSILCVGTPSLYQHVSNLRRDRDETFKTFLLDIDERFIKLYQDGVCLYNMCNHHFFHDSSQYTRFLSNSEKLAVIVDPPFGVKVELIWHGCLLGVQKDLEQLRRGSDNPRNAILDFEAFWIFPYFMEGHILKCSESRLQMSDFHVEYRNHAKYNKSASRTKSSPIRIFTTVPLSSLKLPKNEYRYCDMCVKWVDKKNSHCDSCGTCTTKDGGPSYTHCKKCAKCVKPTWKHCLKCNSCHLMDSACKNAQQGQHEANGDINTAPIKQKDGVYKRTNNLNVKPAKRKNKNKK